MDKASDASFDFHLSNDGQRGESFDSHPFLALMYLYGPNQSTNTLDDLYAITNIDEHTVIYDAGGEDTVSFEAIPNGMLVVLPNDLLAADGFTSSVDIPVGAFDHNLDTEAVTGYLLGDIENLICGSGDDNIVGNQLDNVIKAGGGDDQIVLSQGDDVIYGGTGADTFYAQAAMGNTYYIGTNTLIKDFEIGIDTLSVLEGSEALSYSRNDDGYATYTNDAGVYVVLEGIEANVLLIA